MCATCPIHLILLDLIILIIFGEDTIYEALHYAVFCNLLSLHLSSVQIFSSPCSQTPSVCVPPLMSETYETTGKRKPAMLHNVRLFVCSVFIWNTVQSEEEESYVGACCKLEELSSWTLSVSHLRSGRRLETCRTAPARSLWSARREEKVININIGDTEEYYLLGHNTV
jgi:hypothetical protein